MTTLTKDHNNHPAHDPLTSRRLNQMRDILSKAAAQRDGGDIGYAMSDAVKLIDEVLSSEPVAWVSKKKTTGEIELDDPHAIATNPKYWTDAFPVYTSPQPTQVVPDALPENDDEDGNDIDYMEPAEVYELGRKAGWNAFRAAILQDGNSPTIPDCWIKCGDRMPDKYDFDIWVFSPTKGVKDGVAWDGSGFSDDEYQFTIKDATHWMKKQYPAAPQQEVNRG